MSFDSTRLVGRTYPHQEGGRGTPYILGGSIYSNLYTAFSVPRYQELPEGEWPQVVQWFKKQIEQARGYLVSGLPPGMTIS